MKKLKNSCLQKTGKYAQLLNAEGKLVFEGILQKKCRMDKWLPYVWFLKGNDGLMHPFVELEKENSVVFGPIGATQVRAFENYLVFEHNSEWFGQYFSKNEVMFLGRRINLKTNFGSESFLFYSSYALYYATDRKIQKYDCFSCEKIKLIAHDEELLWVKGRKGQNFLFDGNGKYEAKGEILFCKKSSGEGLILRYLKGRKEYKILYEGAYLQYYAVDEYYVDGERTDTADVHCWEAQDIFIVPDDEQAKTGVLYKIEKNKVKKMAKGKLRFICHFISRANAYPNLENRVQVGSKTYWI